MKKLNKEDYYNEYLDDYFISDEDLDDYAIKKNMSNSDNQHTAESLESFCKEIGAEKLLYLSASATGSKGMYEIVFADFPRWEIPRILQIVNDMKGRLWTINGWLNTREKEVVKILSKQGIIDMIDDKPFLTEEGKKRLVKIGVTPR